MATLLPPELEEFVQDELAHGRFASEADIHVAGIRLLRDQLHELRREIAVGLEELARGEGTVIETEEELRAFGERIKARGRERLRSKQG